MFTWLNKQGVQSDRGFIVQFTGRFSAEYREGPNVVTLDVESGMSGDQPCIILDPDAFSCWDSGKSIPQDQTQELFERLRQALDFQGLKLVIERAETPRD